MAKLYKITGEVQDIEPKDKKKGFQLQELYDLLETYIIQPVWFAKEQIFICDEEGWLKFGARRNEKANEAITSISGDDWDVCGNVIICDDKEFK